MPPAPRHPILVRPEPRERAWAGTRLGRDEERIGELWLAWGGSRTADGPGPGTTLDELAERHGSALLGTRGILAARGRFPLLAKLLDTGAWLSVQVHPDDALAATYEGRDACGKDEAWVVLAAAPSSAILVGARPGAGPLRLRAAVGGPGLLPLLDLRSVSAGDLVDVPARTIHALGPGLLVYEIQQPSDTTYRLHDWGRTDRAIHIREGRRTIDARRRARLSPGGASVDGEVIRSPKFVLERRFVGAHGIDLAPHPASCRVLSVVSGSPRLTSGSWDRVLGARETVVIPAAAGAVSLVATSPADILVASVP